MAVFQGQLFCGTLPSGRVHALQVGQCVTDDRELNAGWRHLVAVRERGRIGLYIDGKLVASSSRSDSAPLDLSNDEPLLIGMGTHDYYRGSLSDLRLYGRALMAREIADLATTKERRERP
jgi:hypothetical protein